MFRLVEGGGQVVVNASTYDRVLQGESAPERLLLEELEAVELKDKGKGAVGNGTGFGGVLAGEKEMGEQKEPIHLRRREGKMRGGGFLRDEGMGGGGDGFIPRELDLGV